MILLPRGLSLSLERLIKESLANSWTFPQSPAQNLAVLGFFIKVVDDGESGHDGHGLSELNEGVFEHVGGCAIPGSTCETGPLLFGELETLLKHTLVYQYSGSLTTPPCTEGVRWNVARDPITISSKTFDKVRKIIGFNARYTQNTPGSINLLDNSRVVLNNNPPRA